MLHENEVLWQGGNGGTAWETSPGCCIMRKVMRKDVGAGGRFDFFSGLCVPIRGCIFVPYFRYLGVAVQPLLHSRPFFMKKIFIFLLLFSLLFSFLFCFLCYALRIFFHFYLPFFIIFFYRLSS